MNWNIYYKGTHKVYSALILNSVGVQWIGLGPGSGALSHQMEPYRDQIQCVKSFILHLLCLFFPIWQTAHIEQAGPGRAWASFGKTSEDIYHAGLSSGHF